MNRLFRVVGALGGLLGRACGRFAARIVRLLEICAMFHRLLLGVFIGPPFLGLFFRELSRQVYFTAIRRAYILVFTSLMLGMLVIVHATQQLVKFQGEEFIGWLLVTIVVREVGPVWAAFFVLLNSGGAITVEIGNMSVNQEIRALKMMGIDPYRYLGVPRFWGLTISLLCLYILCVFTSIIGGYLFAQAFAEIFWTKFWLSFVNALQWIDLSVGFAKTTLFAMLIATVSIYFGFSCRVNLDEVARNTSLAAIWSLVLIGAVDIILTTAYYL
jgi:phospholipid/cholesterol/gamma-HCH transport system permease protein